jgi:hypothetical protein
MLQLDLRAVSAFFCNSKGYDAWRNPVTDEKIQQDHFLVPRYHPKLVKDIRKKHCRVPTDHCAPLLTRDIDRGKNKMMKRRKRSKRISE